MLDEWVSWGTSVFPSELSVDDVRLPQEMKGIERAALNILVGLRAGQAGEIGEAVALPFANGLNGLASAWREGGRSEDAIRAFSAAFSLLASEFPRDRQSDSVRRSIGFSVANLKSMEQAPPETLEPPEGDAVWLDADTLLRPYTRTNDLAVLEPELSGAETVDLTLEQTIEGLTRRWLPDRLDVRAQLRGLRDYLVSEFDRTGLMGRDLGKLVDRDMERAFALFEESNLPGARTDVEFSARFLRSLAFKARDDHDEQRAAWFLSALLNFVLWTAPGGLETNKPQLQIDLLGYLGITLQELRYSDSERDLVLDCAEAMVRVGHGVAAVVLARFDYLRKWLEVAAGTYLLLAGPNPSRPSESYYDQRIFSEDAPVGRGLGRADRQDWATMLLSLWQANEDSIRGAGYALASMCAWDLARSKWLLEFLFSRSPANARPVERDFWIDHVTDLLGRVDKVRIATNPWGSGGGSGSRESMITRLSDGALRIPDPVLRAAAAEGLHIEDAVTVHGQLFAGRRVPTYLLSNRFGPFAILKIDDRDKVLREVRNFERFAQRLHQSNRPSDCAAHGMDMYLGEDGTPLRAIQTSYVFAPEDKPLTLKRWLVDNPEPEVATDVLERFLLTSMRPWLAHVRRARIDLRAEYPVFRASAVPDKQSPNRWAKTELDRLKRAVKLDWDADAGASRQLSDDFTWSGVTDAHPVLSALTDPLWLAAEVAELGTGELSWLVDSFEVGLRDFDTLITLCHGDLHLENVLVAGASERRIPRPVLIDFESAHYGHVCKDLARIEAAALCQVTDWSAGDLGAVVKWFAGSPLVSDVVGQLADPGQPLEGGSDDVRLAVSLSTKMREVAAGCGQSLWPISGEEYLVALVGNLLPMARFSTLSMNQRKLALVLAAVASSALLQRWERMGTS